MDAAFESPNAQRVEAVARVLPVVEPTAEVPAGGEWAFSRAAPARYLPLLALLLVLATVAAVRYRFLATPLERDEGEFAYGGQLILAGERPYASMYAMKLPGIYLIYALIEAAFGQTAFAIHLGLLLVNLACITLMFVVGHKLVNSTTGVVAAAIFAVMTLSPVVQGTQAQAEHFVIFFALLGMVFLLSQNRRYEWLYCLLGGLAFGMAFLCKQHGFVFPLFGLTYLVLREPARWKCEPGALVGELSAMLLGCLIPWLMCCAVFVVTDTLGDFVFWTFTYPAEYVALLRPEQQLEQAVSAISLQLRQVGAFWIAAVVGLSALSWYGPARRWRTCVLLLLVFCCVGIMPGGYYRKHYFVFMAAPLALLAAMGWYGLAAAYRAQGGGRALPLVLLVMIFSWPVLCLVRFYGPHDATSLSGALYPGCPFRAAEDLSHYLVQNTSPEDRIAIFGSEPEVLFYTKRRSATGHIYMYPLMEPHPYAVRMQQQMIDEVEASRPKFIVLFTELSSWFSKPGADPRHFQKWMDTFVTNHYDTMVVVEMDPEKLTYHWGDKIQQLDTLSQVAIIVHKRR